MTQFSLPSNSKIIKGNYYKDQTGSKNIRKVNVYRWSPEDQKNPRVDTFEVDMNNCGPKVLDILFKIKNEIDPSLTFRRSCAHGVCGSCAMNVDGVNTLSCIKSHSDIKGDLNIYPLPHLRVIKDLIGDLSNLYKQYESIQPWLKTSKTEKENKKLTNHNKIDRSWTVTTNVFYVHAAQLPVQVIGGMEISILVRQSYYKLTDGLMIAEMKKKKKDFRKLQMS